jgi:hypothetical protein
MKSPREILFGRHASAQSDLDNLRSRFLAQMENVETRRSIREALWRELFLPARRVWLALGSAWVVVIILRAAAGDDFHTPVALPSEPMPAESMFALRRQWMASETETPQEPSAVPPKNADKRPRAELIAAEKIV